MWVTLLSGLLAIAKPIFEYFNAAARLARLQGQLAVYAARQEVEGERLAATYAQIEAKPAESDAEALAKRLREKFSKP